MAKDDQLAAQELCLIVKRCMRDISDLSHGGRDFPDVVENFARSIDQIRGRLSQGEISKIIDRELAMIESDSPIDLDDTGKDELRELIAKEFRACSRYNLDKFVSVKSIIRTVAQSASNETTASPRDQIQVQSSKQISEILGKNANAYLAQLARVRNVSSIKSDGNNAPTHREVADANRASIKLKKETKRNIQRGMYNTLAGIVFISCNTVTMQMKSSAAFASKHFSAAAKDLFVRE